MGGAGGGQSNTLATLPQGRNLVPIVRIELILYAFQFIMNGEIRGNLENDTFI